MQASTVNGGSIKSLFEVLKEFLDSLNIIYSPDGMSANAFDVNNVALINFNLPKDAFEQYYCQKTLVACVSMNVMHNALAAVGATGTHLVQTIDQKHPDSLQVKIFDTHTKFKALNTLKLWSFSAEHLDLPNSAFDFHIEMPSVYLQTHINHLAKMMANENKNKQVEIYVSPEGAFDLAISGGFGNCRLSLGSSESESKVKIVDGLVDPLAPNYGITDEVPQNDVDDSVVVTTGKKRKGEKLESKKNSVKPFGVATFENNDTDSQPEEVKKTPAVKREAVREYFNIKYVKSIVKAATLSETVQIFIRAGFPIIFMYRIGTKGKLCLCLSPANTNPTGENGGVDDLGPVNATDEDNEIFEEDDGETTAQFVAEENQI